MIRRIEESGDYSITESKFVIRSLNRFLLSGYRTPGCSETEPHSARTRVEEGLCYSLSFFLLLLYFIIGVQSLYNVGLISAVQQSESAMKVKVLVIQLCLTVLQTLGL